MIDGFESQSDMINSVSDGFTNQINDVVPEEIELLCDQDGYEILTKAFGRNFRKRSIESASLSQISSVAGELSEFLEREVTDNEVCNFLNGALHQAFGNYNCVQTET